MIRSSSSQETTFGYLSVVHSAEHGYFGGYLVITALGRPLEFHCSAPVRPSRAQEILYGPTLQPYLLGEQIGGALLGRAKLQPRMILTDHAATLCLRGKMDVPLVRLRTEGDPAIGLHTATPETDLRFTSYGHEFEMAAGFSADRELVMDLLDELASHVDLAEPFGRIHEAIREAQRIGGEGQDTHAQAA